MSNFRATRRRARKADALASHGAVSDILNQVRTALPDIIPRKDKDLVRMLRAVRHIQRYPATDTKRGRPSRWRREDLLQLATCLSGILDRETSSSISVASFIDHYLRVLDFPSDVIESLTSHNINLFEAEQLARLTPERLNMTPALAKRTRAEFLSTHLQTNASGERLRQRVNEFFRGLSVKEGEAAETVGVTQTLENPESFDPYDPTHLFWDQLQQLGFAFRDIRPEDVSDKEIEELLKASEPILALLNRIQKRKERKTSPKFLV